MSELETLIRNYVDSNNINAIVSLAESLKDSRDRAEFKNQAYLHEIGRLAKSFAAITEPNTGRRVTDHEPRNQATTTQIAAKPKPKVTSKPDLSVDIEL